MAINEGSPEWFIAGMNGGQVIAFTSFLGFQYTGNASLPTKPVENGAFITANKWRNPYTAEVSLARSGTANEIAQTLQQLDELLESLDLISIVTPVKTFVNGNVENIEYEFSGDSTGPSMVLPRITIKEVKLFTTSESTTSAIQSANTKNSDATSSRIGGQVQTSEASSQLVQMGVTPGGQR